jgi:hypothetical protein
MGAHDNSKAHCFADPGEAWQRTEAFLMDEMLSADLGGSTAAAP